MFLWIYTLFDYKHLVEMVLFLFRDYIWCWWIAFKPGLSAKKKKALPECLTIKIIGQSRSSGLQSWKEKHSHYSFLHRNQIKQAGAFSNSDFKNMPDLENSKWVSHSGRSFPKHCSLYFSTMKGMYLIQKISNKI